MATSPLTLRRVRLDDPLQCGDITVAAIVEQTVQCAFLHACLIQGAKRPLAVLIHRQGHTIAFEMDGTPLDLRELEARFPVRRAELERQMQGLHRS